MDNYSDNRDNEWDDSTVFGGGTRLLPDGNKLNYEAWGEDGYTFLTYTISNEGIHNFSKEQIVNYLISQGVKIDLAKFPIERIELIHEKDKFKLTITIGESDD